MTNEKGNARLFQELEALLAEQEPKGVFKVERDRWAATTMLIGTLLTVPSILGAKGWGIWSAAIGLPIELCALAVLTYRQLRDVIPEFVDAKRKFAVELDSHFVEYEKIRVWLQSFAYEVRRRHLAYVESRLESMARRYPLVFGAADRLGVLPALIGLFLQVQGISSLSMAAGIVGLMVLLLYAMALWMARFRLQLETYARILKAAGNE
jgi:hypothetical protein